jgi:hypothetical protein
MNKLAHRRDVHDGELLWAFLRVFHIVLLEANRQVMGQLCSAKQHD